VDTIRIELKGNSVKNFDKPLTHNGYFDIAVIKEIGCSVKVNKMLFVIRLLAEKER